ncbi:hypothetical protein EDD11_004515 [Mortierella claussenii]|nr:hypothetical protein EDD11_004515 [Mortierella claussenii]
MSSKELLGEYSKLASKLEHINVTLQEMNAVDIAQLIDKMRIVERKMGLVYTLFKSSVYAVTVQEQEQEQEQELAQELQEQDQLRSSLQYHQDQDRRQSMDQSYSQQQYQDEGNQQQQRWQPQQLSYQQTSSQLVSPNRRSRYSSNEGIGNSNNTSALRTSQTRNSSASALASRPTILRVSNANAAREEFQAQQAQAQVPTHSLERSASGTQYNTSGSNNNSGSNAKSVLSVSRGYTSSRWSQGPIRDLNSNGYTNRPRF